MSEVDYQKSVTKIIHLLEKVYEDWIINSFKVTVGFRVSNNRTYPKCLNSSVYRAR